MKSERRHLPTWFIMFFLMICLIPEARSDGSVLYDIKVQPDSPSSALKIRARFDSLSHDNLILWSNRSAGVLSDMELIDGVVAFDDEEKKIALTKNRNGDWVLDRHSSSLTIQYEVKTKHDSTIADKTGSLSLPHSAPDYVIFVPSFVLLRPKGDLSHLSASVAFAKPNGWVVSSAFVDYTHMEDFSSFLQSYAIAYKRDSMVETKNRDSSITLLWAKHPELENFLKTEGPQKLVSALDEQMHDFSRDRSKRHVGFALNGEMGGIYRGQAENRSFLLMWNPKAPELPGLFSTGTGSIVQALSHEFFHFWENEVIPHDRGKGEEKEAAGDLRWFQEGFTDYFSYYYLLTSEMISIDTFIEMIQANRAQITQGGTSTDKVNVLLASRNFFSDSMAQSLCYKQGALLALQLDKILKEASAGKKTLLGFMKAFFQDYGLTYDAFKKALDSYAAGASSKIAPYIEGAKAIDLEEVFEFFGGKSVHTEVRYILGSRRAEKPIPLCLIDPPKRLKDFGLESGDCIVGVGGKELSSLDQLYAFKDTPFPVEVLRNGKSLVVSVSLLKVVDTRWKFTDFRPFL